MPIAAGTPAYRRLRLALLITGFTTFGLLYCVQSLLPVFSQTFAVSAAEASLVVSLATGPMAFMLLFASVVSDRVGRRPLMTASLFAGSVLAVVSAVVPGWHTLLVVRFLIGIAISGIPAIAMTYVAEEVDASSLGGAMGLYISGSALGGMSSRIIASALADWLGWRAALGFIGLLSVVGALVFWRSAPQSRAFVPHKHDWASFAASLRALKNDAALPWLYAESFLLMGSFVTLYNFVAFHLLAPPYSLSQTAVGFIFLFYIVGSVSSTWFGELAGRLGRRRIFWIPLFIMLAGVAMTAATPIICIVVGVGVATVGYFGAHSIASSWVSRRGRAARTQAASFYLFFLYLGSSVLGTTGGVAWSRSGWMGVATFIGALLMVALLIALRLVAVKPLPENQ